MEMYTFSDANLLTQKIETVWVVFWKTSEIKVKILQLFWRIISKFFSGEYVELFFKLLSSLGGKLLQNMYVFILLQQK